MIYLIGNAPESSLYRKMTMERFIVWWGNQKDYQLDTETNITDWWCDKKLISIQFGDMDGRNQWVLQWSYLSDSEKAIVKQILEDATKAKYIHNAMFECIVLLFHSIRISNVYDTMLAELILNTGMDFLVQSPTEELSDEGIATAGYFALTSLSDRYLCKRMDKTSQMTFGDDILTEDKVVYAAQDVVPLGAISRMQKQRISGEDLEYVLALENEAVLAFSEMTFTGMPMDVPKWRENIELAVPVIAAAKIKMDSYLEQEAFWRVAMDKGFWDMYDRVTINWNSPKQRQAIIEHYFPYLIGMVSKPVLKRLLKDESQFADELSLTVVKSFYEGTHSKLETIMIEEDRNWLIDHEMLIAGGTGNINWNSPPQAIAILQCVKKNIASTNEETLGKVSHPIAKDLQAYRSALKLLTTYGESFITKNLDPTGRVRTSFRQIMSTGRVGSYRPNMQNIIVTEEVGTRYRNAFVVEEGWEYVSSDWTGQELVIMALMSQEPVFLKALKEGKDIHSICAEMMYGKKWKDATSEGCTYYKIGPDNKPMHQKCNCKKHKQLRYDIKCVNFGIPYGMSEFKLSGTLGIPLSEAKALLALHERLFSKLWAMIRYLRRFVIDNGYIMTLAPFYRKRWFPQWKWVSKEMREQHIAGQYEPTLGAIEREGGNMPIQGSGADMAKVAMVRMYQHIHDNHLEDRVKLAMQVHDQIDTHCRKDFTEVWKPVMHQIMIESALLIVPNGLLGADTGVSPVWTK